MNADILKPFLAEAVAAFPAQSIELVMRCEQDISGRELPAAYQSLVKIGSSHFWGESFEVAMAKAKQEFTPEKQTRQQIATKLRAQADRIASGTEPIPDAV